MSQYLESARKFHQTIREVLLKEWDPIGVANNLEAQDEYDSYVTQIYGLILRRESNEGIFNYLWWAETVSMGLCGNRKRTKLVAEKLQKLGKPERSCD